MRASFTDGRLLSSHCTRHEEVKLRLDRLSVAVLLCWRIPKWLRCYRQSCLGREARKPGVNDDGFNGAFDPAIVSVGGVTGGGRERCSGAVVVQCIRGQSLEVSQCQDVKALLWRG